MVKFPERKCLRCGHIWIIRVEKPGYCPKCKSPKWNEIKRKNDKI